jgi:hypothetical protein
MIWMVAVAVDEGSGSGSSGGDDENNKNGRNSEGSCKGNLTDLRRILHLSLAKGNPKRTL